MLVKRGPVVVVTNCGVTSDDTADTMTILWFSAKRPRRLEMIWYRIASRICNYTLNLTLWNGSSIKPDAFRWEGFRLGFSLTFTFLFCRLSGQSWLDKGTSHSNVHYYCFRWGREACQEAFRPCAIPIQYILVMHTDGEIVPDNHFYNDTFTGSV